MAGFFAYALTMAVLIPASGWLADRLGTRRVFVTAIALFAMGSLLCASSLAGFAGLPGHDAAHPLPAFHATFLCVGLMTFASAWIFWQLPKMKDL